MLRLLALLILASPASAQTLDTIRVTNHFACGVVTNDDDWDHTDVHGNLSQLGADICRAVSVAILGSADAVDIRSFRGEAEALAAMQAGGVQLLAGITPESRLAMHYGIGFGPPIFFDSTRILTSIPGGITDLAGLHGQLICDMDLTDPARALHDAMVVRDIPYAVMSHSEQGEMDAAIAVRRCAAGAAMESRLAQSRANFHARTLDFAFLPERFGLEPLVPAYPYGDQAFGLIVDWTVYALIEAEALGITRANVAQAGARGDMRAERLLGGDFATAQALGLAHDWAAQVIAATGNYGEIFVRDVGGPMRLDRGPNALWTEGGLMRPLPMR